MATNLTEENRLKLDGIVSQMVTNQEPEENIQWVVNDFKQKYGGMSPASQPAKQPVTVDSEMQPYIDTLNPIEKTLIGVGKGMSDIYTGIKQRGAEVGNKLGLVSPETVKGIQQKVQTDRDVFKPLASQSFAAKAGEFTGQVIPTLAIPGGVTGGALKRALTSSLAGGAMGAMQPTVEGESAITNTGIGAATGGAMSGLLSGVGKGYNAIKGKIPSNPIRNEASAFGIRTTLGEETGKPFTQWVESMQEKIPLGLGIGKFRKQQNQEAENAAKNWFGQYLAPDVSRESLTAAKEANSAYASSLFEDMKGIVAGIADQPVQPDQTRAVVGSLLKKYPNIFKDFQDTERESILRGILNDTKPMVTPSSVSPIVAGSKYGLGSSPIVSPSASVPKTLTFEEAWTLRKGLGTMIGQARKKLAAGEIDKTQLSEMSQAYGAINRDIDNWIQKANAPEVKQAMNTANEAYKQYVVRFDVLDDIMAKATGQSGAGEMFSPKRLSTMLKNTSWKQYSLKDFTPAQINEMTGLANVMQVVKRAGQYMENPPTGNRLALPVASTAIAEMARIVGIPTATIAGTLAAEVGVTGIAKFLTSTTTGKNLVLAASRIEPSSPGMTTVLNQIYKQAPKYMAMEATNDNVPFEDRESQPNNFNPIDFLRGNAEANE